MFFRRLFIMTVAALCAVTAFAQNEGRWSSSIYLPAAAKPDVTLPFDISAEGKRYQMTWGLDLAWDNEQNLRKGVNHMGVENVGIGRTSYRVYKPLINDVSLTTEQIQGLKTRSALFDKYVSKKLPLVINCDNGYIEEGHIGSNINTYYTLNRQANVEHWAKAIEGHVVWMKDNTSHPVVGVSVFNEPDFDGWDNELIQGTPENLRDIAKTLKTYPSMEGVAITGGNTLSNNNALTWYTPGKAYIDWGNTHQLNGGFDSYVKFYQQVCKDGKVGMGDEMHNVVEAMVGMEYGMTVGIWWGFDSRVRGEFCQFSNHGQRLAYAEHGANWTAASVWRHDDGRVKVFVGSSERDAKTTNYQFVTDRQVYYDGYGPQREYVYTIPGGTVTGDPSANLNAEYVMDVTWGDDVPVAPVTPGVYRIVNRSASGKAIVSSSAGAGISLSDFSASNNRQKWAFKHLTNRTAGDRSFFDIEAVNTPNLRMNVENYSLNSGGRIIAWIQENGPTTNEQWYLEYAGDGYYYIRCRESALYLAASGTDVIQSTLPSSTLDRYLLQWRIIPDSVTTYDRTAPSQVTGLSAAPQTAAVTLSWNANTNKDISGYIVVRAEKGSDEWNTIGRMIQGTTFTDNTCRPGVTYLYKVKAVDLSHNRSRNFSEIVECAATGQRAMVAQWQMNESLEDATDNMMDARFCGTPIYQDGHDGTKSLWLNGSNGQYLQLPYEVAGSQELTVSMWVYLRSGVAWQRLFDFGLDTEHYLFLSPSDGNGSNMRFAIKNGGEEQTLDAPKLPTFQWKHVVLAIGADKTAIYVDGEQAATSSSITIRPSDVKPCMNYIGRSQFTADPLMNAFVDDVRIYNFAVTADDVKSIMGGRQPTALKAVVSTPAANEKVYGLNGVQRSENSRGVIITGGRKVLKKR